MSGAINAADLWGYHEDRPGQAGPSNWASINAACNGTHQSPINLEYSGDSVINLWGTTNGVAPIKFHGDCENFNLKALEDLYKWELTGDSKCKISLELQDGKTYSLAQFHVHTPSEHTIEGHHYSDEIHFVHKEDGGGGLLATGLLLNPEEDVGGGRVAREGLGDHERGRRGPDDLSQPRAQLRGPGQRHGAQEPPVQLQRQSHHVAVQRDRQLVGDQQPALDLTRRAHAPAREVLGVSGDRQRPRQPPDPGPERLPGQVRLSDISTLEPELNASGSPKPASVREMNE